MTATIQKTKPTNTRTEDVYRAAAELMVNKGFGGTSIADIAKLPQAQVSMSVSHQITLLSL